MYKLISDAKKERIDKQYYVTAEKDEITMEIAKELLNDAEDFGLKMKVVISGLDNDFIEEIRRKFDSLIGWLVHHLLPIFDFFLGYDTP